ncbi:hypothetical protein E3N88_39959 [Mikania micrantha]|uniref:Uncharacterized protein n=1 Tax=Mikania micrantha TaxID=192012 RepID=A0A5N6LLA4_9ASTR|nr:hypothetical protein E3N88_39959 [Mikania micrantha]
MIISQEKMFVNAKQSKNELKHQNWANWAHSASQAVRLGPMFGPRRYAKHQAALRLASRGHVRRYAWKLQMPKPP